MDKDKAGSALRALVMGRTLQAAGREWGADDLKQAGDRMVETSARELRTLADHLAMFRQWLATRKTS